jgi:hypothetical protein
MFLISLAFAWVVFIGGLNYTDKVWKCAVAGVVTFITFFLIQQFGTFELFAIATGIIVVAVLIALIALHRR